MDCGTIKSDTKIFAEKQTNIIVFSDHIKNVEAVAIAI